MAQEQDVVQHCTLSPLIGSVQGTTAALGQFNIAPTAKTWHLEASIPLEWNST
jgi:hypothetical protein